MGVGVQRQAPAALLPEYKALYPLYRRLGGLQDRSGRVREISPPTGFDPQTVKPVVSRDTDCTFPARCCTLVWSIRLWVLLYLLRRNFPWLPLSLSFSLTPTLHCSNLSSWEWAVHLLLFQWWIRYEAFIFERVVAYKIEQTLRRSRIWQPHWISEAGKRNVGEEKKYDKPQVLNLF